MLGHLEDNYKLAIVLLDLKLGEVNGVDVLKDIRAKYPGKPVVLMTGYRKEMGDSIEKARKIGAYTCLYKPFEMDGLFQLIEEIRHQEIAEHAGYAMKGKAKILVVDDDPNLRKTLADILRVKGYATAVAANGAEAIAAAEQEMCSLALIDLMLPDMPGLEVMARIKAISPLTEAIILTGHASMDTAIEATGQGAFSYLLKPYQMDELLQKIGHAVERQQAQEEILRLASFPRLFPSPVIELDPCR